MKRSISVSEVGTLLTCQRRHSFAYTGHVTAGHTLRRRNPAIRLREGRAWGRAVAALHATQEIEIAVEALRFALEEDANEQRAASVYVADEHMEMLGKLLALLSHYEQTSEPLWLKDAERELVVPLPSRSGKRLSNRYVFQGFIDGLTDGYRLPGLWIVEYKLRDNLSSLEQVAASRQIRWYAWAAERVLDQPIQGVIVDERRNAVPKPARMVHGRKKDEGMVPSHAKDQLCTADAYKDACAQAGVEPNPETVSALASRRWQARHTVMLRRDEIEEAGRELVSAAQAVADMDSGARYPVANRGAFTCPMCPYRDICDRPQDLDAISLDFDLTEPKRLRAQEEREVSAPLETPTPIAA